MGWVRWGLRAARRSSRASRRRGTPYQDAGYALIAHLVNRSAQKKQANRSPAPPVVPKTLVAPSTFTLEPAWEWDESDRDYYRYATEKWKVYLYAAWGILALPPGKDSGYNFFGIVALRQSDDKGALAHGAGDAGGMDGSLPVLLLFRITDGYNAAFAAVQSWSLVEELIEQDRPLQEARQYPRASYPGV